VILVSGCAHMRYGALKLTYSFKHGALRQGRLELMSTYDWSSDPFRYGPTGYIPLLKSAPESISHKN